MGCIAEIDRYRRQPAQIERPRSGRDVGAVVQWCIRYVQQDKQIIPPLVIARPASSSASRAVGAAVAGRGSLCLRLQIEEADGVDAILHLPG